MPAAETDTGRKKDLNKHAIPNSSSNNIGILLQTQYQDGGQQTRIIYEWRAYKATTRKHVTHKSYFMSFVACFPECIFNAFGLNVFTINPYTYNNEERMINSKR